MPGVDAATDARAPVGEGIRHAVGLHPWYLTDDLEEQLDALRVRAAQAGVVAIGETGLDAMKRAGPRDRQERAFSSQIALAARLRLPLILHVVRRHGACLEMLAAEGFPSTLGGMVHDFGGPAEMIAPWVKAGFALSISPRSVGREPREAMVAAIPEDALLVETDDFGVERLEEVIAWVASARGESPDTIARLTAANAEALFG